MRVCLTEGEREPEGGRESGRGEREAGKEAGREGGREGGNKRPCWRGGACGGDDVIGTVGGGSGKTARAVLILFAALKGMDGGQGREFWETI